MIALYFALLVWLFALVAVVGVFVGVMALYVAPLVIWDLLTKGHLRDWR